MVLQFNPPEDLINAYLNRPSPGQVASDSVNKALQMYAAEKNSQEQKASLEAQRKSAEFKAIADYIPEDQIPSVARNYGINIPPSGNVPPTVSSGTMTPVEVAAQQSLPAEHPNTGTPEVSPLIQAHAQSTGFNPLGVNVPTSKAGLEKFQKNITAQHAGLEAQKIQKELNAPPAGPDPVYTHAQALSMGTVPHNARLAEVPQPRGAGAEGTDAKLTDKQLADAQKSYNSDKTRQKAEDVVERVSTAVPLLNAGVIDNATAKQALQTTMAYMATGGMRVNQTELQQFGGAQAVSNKMAQWFKGLDAGTLTPRDAKDMANVLDIFQKSAHKNLQDVGLRHTRQYLQRSQTGEGESDAYKRVTGADFASDPSYANDNLDTTPAIEEGYSYTPGPGGRANQANWKKQ